MSLTGRFNFRETWLTGLALDVEEEVKPRFGGAGKLTRRWRRAKLTDLERPEMRDLTELRFRLQFLARAPQAAAVAPSAAENVAGDVSEGASAPAGSAAPRPQRVSH